MGFRTGGGDNTELVLNVGLDLDQAKDQTDKLKSNVEKAGKEAADGFDNNFSKRLNISFSKLAAGAAAAVAVIGTGKLFGKAIEEASRQESAINALNAALAQTGKFSEQTSKSIDDFATDLEKTTKFAGDAILQNAALIQSLGNLDEQGLKRATKAALDFAAATGKDASTAATLVGKAAAGQVEAFTRFGVKIQKGKTDAETFANALDALEKKFGGRAETTLNTFSGAVTALGNAFGKPLEEIGNLIIKSPVVVGAINGLRNAFINLADIIKKGIGGKDLFGNFIVSLVPVIQFVTTVLVPVFETAFNIITTGFRTVFNFAQILFDFLVSNVGSRFEYFTKLLSGDIEGANKALTDGFDSMKESAKTNFEDIAESANTAFETPFADFIEEQTDRSLIALENLSNGFLKANEKIKNNQPVTEEVKQKQFELLNDLDAGFTSFFTSSTQAIVNAGKQISSTFVGGLSRSFAKVGEALVTGENALKAFAQGILGTFGDVLIQLGTAVLTFGLGAIFLPALFGAQGAAALALGPALIVAGGALKAFAGGGGAGAAGATSGGGGGVVGGGADNESPDFGTADVAERQTGTSVQVIVQGNILDRRESGLEIAEILRESFDTEGVLINA